MRKVVYSNVLKIVAVCLFIVSIVSAVLVATNGILNYFDQDVDIYAGEEDFSQSWYISSLLATPENLVLNVYYDVF